MSGVLTSFDAMFDLVSTIEVCRKVPCLSITRTDLRTFFYSPPTQRVVYFTNYVRLEVSDSTEILLNIFIIFNKNEDEPGR